MKLTKKRIFAGVVTLAFVMMLVMPSAASAASCGDYDVGDCGASSTAEAHGCSVNAAGTKCTGFWLPASSTDSNADMDTILGNVVNTITGILGFVAVIMILIGGFQWMTAGGEDGKVDKAKGTLKNGIIGLVIVAGAWVIIKFVLTIIFGG